MQQSEDKREMRRAAFQTVLRSYVNFPPAAALALLCFAGCDRDGAPASKATEEVVLYYSVDEAFARDIIAGFTKKTGIAVRPQGDSEAGKTTGLVNLIRAQKDAPKADVFWSSELFNTIELAEEGLLASYESPAAKDIPKEYLDPQHRWTATAMRARVLAFDTRAVKAEELPARWEDLAAPQWASKLAIANPQFGTTRGHVAAMFALWGTDRAEAFLEALASEGTRIADGNSAAVRLVGDGLALICATDSDDVWSAQKQGLPVGLIYPDMGSGGTLMIPNSVALLEGAPHPNEGRKLVDYLVSTEVERMLANSISRNIPVRPDLRAELGMAMPPAAKIDCAAVAAAMKDAIARTREILLR